jgi:hypothetical protein
MAAVEETWGWCYSIAFILQRWVATVAMDTLYNPELSSVTAETGGIDSGNVSWVSLPGIPWIAAERVQKCTSLLRISILVPGS